MTTLERVTQALKKSPLAAQPKLLTWIADRVDAYESTKHNSDPKLIKRPYHLYCSITGIKCGCTANDYFSKKLFQYGDDIFVLMTTYVSRSAKGTAPARPRAAQSASPVKQPTAPAADTVIVAAPSGQDEYTEVTAWQDEAQEVPLITTTTFEVNGVAKVIFDYNHVSKKTSYRHGTQELYSELKSR